MRKIYYSLILLLCSLSLYAQNPLLAKIFTAPDSNKILDYRYNKVFVAKDSVYHVIDVASGQSTLIPVNKPLSPYGGSGDHLAAYFSRVTPYGAVLMTSSTANPGSAALYEWNQGTLTLLADPVGDVSTAGDYLSYIKSDLLILRNMATLQQTGIDSNVTATGVAENGGVAYTKFYNNPTTYGPTSQVYQYSNGVKTLVADSLPLVEYLYPRIAGAHLTYMRYSFEGGWGSLVLYDGTTNTDLVYVGERDFGGIYQPVQSIPGMNNGYIGGVYPTALDWRFHAENVWIRDLQGNIRILASTRSGTNTVPFNHAYMGALDRDGNMALYAGPLQAGDIYYFTKEGLVKRIFADPFNKGYTGHLFLDDTTWAIATDTFHVLYKVNVDTVYDHHVVPFEKSTLPQTRVPFTAGDFTQHYAGPATGPGQLQQVKFTVLPKHGFLVTKGNTIIQATNNTVLRSDLDSLQYSPFGGFTGTDTARWSVFDGVDWTRDTMIFLHVNPAISTDSITPFDKNTFVNTAVSFTASDFAQHFTGQLNKIKITSLPTYGKLTVGGKAVFYERSAEISSASLDSMVYTPKTGILGVDTLQWKAADSIGYTTYDTAVVLHIYPVLSAPPILRTVESQYSSGGPADTILIYNYPPARWHTDVTVKLDSSTALDIWPDHIFEIDPAALTPGLHSVTVTYAHPLDTISTTKSFTVVPSSLLRSAQEKYAVVQEILISTWPNPFNQQFTVTGLQASGTYILTLYDPQGRPVSSQRAVHQSKVDLTLNTGAGKGMYLLKIEDDDKKQLVKTIKLLHL